MAQCIEHWACSTRHLAIAFACKSHLAARHCRVSPKCSPCQKRLATQTNEASNCKMFIRTCLCVTPAATSLHPCTHLDDPGQHPGPPTPIQMSTNLRGHAESGRNGASPRNMDENSSTFARKSKGSLGSPSPCKKLQKVTKCNGLSCDLERNPIAALQKGHKK